MSPGDDLAERMRRIARAHPHAEPRIALFDGADEIDRLRAVVRGYQGRPPAWRDLPVAGNLAARRPALDALHRGGVRTLGDLAEKSPDDLLSLSNFGVTALYQVRDALAARGLALRGDDLTRPRV